jgi:hypothetical protein
VAQATPRSLGVASATRTPPALHPPVLRRGEAGRVAFPSNQPLNGQHYSIRRDYATPAAQTPPDAKKRRNPLQTKSISRSTSDRYRTTAGPLSQQHACPTRRARPNQPRRPPRTPPSQKPWAVSPRMRSPAALRVPVAARRAIPPAAPSRHRRFKIARNRRPQRQSPHYSPRTHISAH